VQDGNGTVVRAIDSNKYAAWSQGDVAQPFIEGPRFVGLRLSPAVYRHRLALELPEAGMARPTGVERADAINIRIPIEGSGVTTEATA